MWGSYLQWFFERAEESYARSLLRSVIKDVRGAMAVNTNKRVATKHIRDGIKSNYKKDTECAVCGTSHELELHHYHTVSILLKNYSAANNIDISTDEAVLAMRDEFYKFHWNELVEDTVTLCNTHHKQLHAIYGREPELSTAPKQRNWVIRLKERLSGRELVGKDSQPNTTGRWASLIGDTSVCGQFTKLI